MFAPPPTGPLHRSVQDAVDAYAQRLSELLVGCAATQREDPEAFLWGSRRALEAICLLVLSAHNHKVERRGGNGRDQGLYALIKELKDAGLLSRQDETRFNAAREHSNLGVHIRQPEREDYRKARDDLGHLLPGLVDWLIDESPAVGHVGRSVEMTNALIDIKQGGWRSAAAPRSTPGVATASVPIPAPDAGLPSADRGSRRLLFLMLSGAGLVVAAATGLAVADGPTQIAVPAAAPVSAPVAVPAAAPVSAQPVAESVPSETTLRDPSAAPVPDDLSTCPAGMVQIDASIIRVGQPQPDRSSWPAASGRLAPAPVAAFCLDRTERTRDQVLAWSGLARVDRDDCVWRDGKANQAAGCLTRAEAAAYCADLVPGGRLPGLLEWESAVRSPQRELVGVHIHREWIDDDFPPEALKRAWPDAGHADEGMFRQQLRSDPSAGGSPDGHLLVSWNRQEVGKRWTNLGFRCARPLATAE